MQQMSLSLEPGLGAKHLTLRDCVGTQVYHIGHGRVAGLLDMAPSKLTEKLAGASSDGKSRGMTLDELERFFEKTKDYTAIYYLIDKYLSDPEVRREQAVSSVLALLESLPAQLAAAGIAPKRKRA
jgi:hypothetical protein